MHIAALREQITAQLIKVADEDPRNVGKVLDLPNSPSSVDKMVLYDATQKKMITQYAETLVGRSLALENEAQTFERVSGDFWYYQLRTFTKLLRNEHWAARHDFNFIVVGNLLALLRLESGATKRWRGASAAVGIEDDISNQRLDVDFIVVTEADLSDEQVHALQRMHGRIYGLDIQWAQHLEGSYFPREVLRHYSRRGQPLWYLDHGSRSLIQSDHCNTIVVRWVVRENGVTLAGPPPATLVDPIPVAELRREIMGTLTGWGQEITAEPDRYNNRFYQSFIVLNYCRMLHDLHTGFPGSKVAGAEWAKANVDPSWNGLIDRAWHGRPNPAVSVRQRADSEEFEKTLKFVQYVIHQSKLYTAPDR